MTGSSVSPDFRDCSIDSHTSKTGMVPPASIEKWKHRHRHRTPAARAFLPYLPDGFIEDGRGNPEVREDTPSAMCTDPP